MDRLRDTFRRSVSPTRKRRWDGKFYTPKFRPRFKRRWKPRFPKVRR